MHHASLHQAMAFRVVARILDRVGATGLSTLFYKHIKWEFRNFLLDILATYSFNTNSTNKLDHVLKGHYVHAFITST